MNLRYEQVARKAGHRCEYCHAPEAIFNFPFEVEHIIPVSRGGSQTDLNLALSCRSCNLHKSSHVTGIEEEEAKQVRLFHPREDRWESHFEVNLESGEIRGVTAIGRATVNRLRMNNEVQVAARKHWMLLEIFP